ncbi:glycosyltransferase [Billgrantia sp. Q4P2]|uniref:glycosyltransferase n=1 Tax=Billgrantia sp. Q4P2 TaxID=3463857 RepID=UPI004056B80C
MKSLCLCIGSLSAGGAERQVVYIASLLADRGYRVSLLVLKGGDAYLEHLNDKVTLKRLGLAGFVSSAKELKSEIKALSPDVVVGFLFHASLLLRSVSPMLDCPVVSVHRNVSCGSFQRDVLMKLTSVFDTLTVSNTRLARQRLHSRLARSDLVVVPNIYFELGRPAERAVSQGSEGLVWGYVGRLEAQKNLPLLLQAFGQHLKSFPGARLHIVGDGPKKSALHALCEQLGISNRVDFLGHTQEVQAELARMDAFIMTSLREGMPNALIEAMAARLPVVATAVGEVSAMIDSGQTGILCEDFSIESISTAMNRVALMRDEERLAMGEAAQTYIVRTCSPAAVIDQWESVLKRAAGCQ